MKKLKYLFIIIFCFFAAVSVYAESDDDFPEEKFIEHEKLYNELCFAGYKQRAACGS